MESWQLALLVLVALLVGAFLPVLFQARATLRAAERHFNSRKLGETLDDLHAAARGFRVLGQRLEGADKEIGEIIEAVRELGQVAAKVRGSMKVASAIGAAVGPAIAAAMRALQEDDDTRTSPEGASVEAASAESPPAEAANVERGGAAREQAERRAP